MKYIVKLMNQFSGKCYLKNTKKLVYIREDCIPKNELHSHCAD